MSDYLDALRHEANCMGTDTHESKVLHEAADRIEELEKQLAVVQWQPIETAPKDEKVILLGLPVCENLWAEDRRVYEGRWNDHENTWTSVNGFILFSVATRWMPLPEPPAIVGDNKE